jgi:hypothetical protein
MASDHPPHIMQHLPPVRTAGAALWPLPPVRISAPSGVTPPLFRSDVVVDGSNESPASAKQPAMPRDQQ